MKFISKSACLLLAAIVWSAAISAVGAEDGAKTIPTGRRITPQGTHAEVGSFPANMAISPDGRFIAVTTMGKREALCILSVTDGSVVSRVDVGKGGKRRTDGSGKAEGLYYGLAFKTAADGGALLFASRGAEDRVAIHAMDANGVLSPEPKFLDSPSGRPGHDSPHNIAGIALSGDGKHLYTANNHTDQASGLKGSMCILDIDANKVEAKIELPGFPFAVAALTPPGGSEKVYVTSERDGVVAAVDPAARKVIAEIATGTHPESLLVAEGGKKLYVANAGSDTLSVIDTRTDKVIDTILVRPDDARGLAGATPLGMALSPDGDELFVALADMNAVAVVDLEKKALRGFIPVGWYPTSVAVAPDGKAIFAANAKGVEALHPNKKPQGPRGGWLHYVLDIMEGTVSRIATPDGEELAKLTQQAIANNFAKREAAAEKIKNPGIEHVIYIVKENRTYDQVLGDLPQGNGDPAICMFPREVTPNLHAIAERFVLLDNFYVCAEVSADGWNWSTSGMISAYTARNSVYNYSDRGRKYDFEGQNNGVPADLLGLTDVAAAPSGYIWDHMLKHGIDFRNYGFFSAFMDDDTVPGLHNPGSEKVAKLNQPTKKALADKTDPDFFLFAMDYADSEAWVTYGATAPKQRKAFGAHNAPSRFSEFKREFDAYAAAGKLPQFLMVRFCCDHTAGTSAGHFSPKAMVADNDYAVGQLVELVSKSAFWKSTAIFIIEDDAQDGHDHVDAHRSTCHVISPFVKRASHDTSFYNTDSVLRTMTGLLGVPPMNQLVDNAPDLDVFGDAPENAEPFTAILPPKEIITQVNKSTAYRSADSDRFDFQKADAVPDDELNDILWHSIKGEDVPAPEIRYGFQLFAGAEADEDGDGDGH